MLEVNKENFETEVLNGDKIVFVEFFGRKCGKCMELMPEVHALSEKYGDKIKFATVDTGKNMRLSLGQKVIGLPTIIMYVNGEKDAVLTPDKISSIADIEAMIKKYY